MMNNKYKIASLGLFTVVMFSVTWWGARAIWPWPCVPKPECLKYNPPCEIYLPPGGVNWCPTR